MCSLPVPRLTLSHTPSASSKVATIYRSICLSQFPSILRDLFCDRPIPAHWPSNRAPPSPVLWFGPNFKTRRICIVIVSLMNIHKNIQITLILKKKISFHEIFSKFIKTVESTLPGLSLMTLASTTFSTDWQSCSLVNNIQMIIYLLQFSLCDNDKIFCFFLKNLFPK